MDLPMTQPAFLCHQPPWCWHNGNVKRVANYLGRDGGSTCAPKHELPLTKSWVNYYPWQMSHLSAAEIMQTLQYCIIPSRDQFPI